MGFKVLKAHRALGWVLRSLKLTKPWDGLEGPTHNHSPPPLTAQPKLLPSLPPAPSEGKRPPSPPPPHHLGPVGQHQPLVIQDDELHVAMRAVGQGRAQVLSDEIPLVFGGETQALEGVEDDFPGRGFVARRHGPEAQVVLGVFIQEPERRDAASAPRPPRPFALPEPHQAPTEGNKRPTLCGICPPVSPSASPSPSWRRWSSSTPVTSKGWRRATAAARLLPEPPAGWGSGGRKGGRSPRVVNE